MRGMEVNPGTAQVSGYEVCGHSLTDSLPPVSCGPHQCDRYTNKQSTHSILSEHGGGNQTTVTVHCKCFEGRKVTEERKVYLVELSHLMTHKNHDAV